MQLVSYHREIIDDGPKSTPLWFRGHSDADWRLETTLKRHGLAPDLEPQLLNRFRQNAVNYLGAQLPNDDASWHWSFLMRHHGAPSRLLDWTESALVGLYFAVEEKPGNVGTDIPQPNGSVWVLLPTALNHKVNVRDPEGKGSSILPMFDVTPGSGLDTYKTSQVARNSHISVPPAAGQAIRSFPRMEAQQSTFTVHHADQKTLEDWHDGDHVWNYCIPANSKSDIRAELRTAGINRLTLFRDLDSAAWEAEEALNA